jgi:hypothetical protein
MSARESRRSHSTPCRSLLFARRLPRCSCKQESGKQRALAAEVWHIDEDSRPDYGRIRTGRAMWSNQMTSASRSKVASGNRV